MFENVGAKIKGLAVVVAWIGIIASVIWGLVIMFSIQSTVTFFTGLTVAGIGSLVSWISSLGLYAFGQLVENSDTLTYRQHEILRRVSAIESSPVMKMNPSAANTSDTNTSGDAAETHKWRCVQCGAMIDTPVCPYCGKGNQL